MRKVINHLFFLKIKLNIKILDQQLTLIVKEHWKFTYDEPLLGIELGDINNNGQIEIVAFTKSGYVLIISIKGELLNKILISENSPIWNLRIFDIDKDGKNEIILGGMDGILNILKSNRDYNFKLFWTHKFDASISGILIDDINNDKLDELIVYSLDKTLRVLNPLNGNLVWGQVFEDGIGDALIFKENIKSINKEIVACGNDGTIRSFDCIDGNLLWFKRFSDKVRCVSYIYLTKGSVIICGGDDKKLHFIDRSTQKEFNTYEFKDFVWKCVSYPFPICNKALVSSYSFAHFSNSFPPEKIRFSSKLICLNESIDIMWEMKGYNIEALKVIEVYDNILVFIGTTKGELIIIEEPSGKILLNKRNNSCLNMIQILTESELLFCCYDNGTIVAYKLEESPS